MMRNIDTTLDQILVLSYRIAKTKWETNREEAQQLARCLTDLDIWMTSGRSIPSWWNQEFDWLAAKESSTPAGADGQDLLH